MLPLSDGIPARRSLRSSERTSKTPWESLAYLIFYFAAMMTQTAMTLLFGAAQDAQVPELGASGASVPIAAVLGAYFARRGDARRRRIGYSQSCH
jgi:membrane associated rhomboid family serine protease